MLLRGGEDSPSSSLCSTHSNSDNCVRAYPIVVCPSSHRHMQGPAFTCMIFSPDSGRWPSASFEINMHVSINDVVASRFPFPFSISSIPLRSIRHYSLTQSFFHYITSNGSLYLKNIYQQCPSKKVRQSPSPDIKIWLRSSIQSLT